MLLTKIVKVMWNSNNKKKYEELGYIFTKMKGELEINVKDLTNGSNILVSVQCDECGKILEGVIWNSYIKRTHDNGKYYCKSCGHKLFATANAIKTKLKNSKSFERWCYDNLDREKADQLLSHWDYDLNRISPLDVSYSSSGPSKKGYWFKCLSHPEHGSEIKNINGFTHYGGMDYMGCTQCRMIATTHPYLKKILVNKDDLLKYSAGSGAKVLARCQICGHEKEVIMHELIKRGIRCNVCSDGISYPEKYLTNMLAQLDIIFSTQVNKLTFKWCGRYSYDYYIGDINCIIEAHGSQHYECPKGSWRTPLIKIQDNDKRKEESARDNGIANYIIIDCRRSKTEWIKNSVMHSELPILLGFTEDDIDWEECHKNTLTSMVKETCELWNSGHKAKKISEILCICRSTANTYLKQGANLGWCNYDPKIELGHNNCNYK